MENARYFKIGLFVISAIVLAVIGVVALGGGVFFQKTNIIETYIDESVQGLDVGSSMRFRGVLVGKVEEITLTSVEYNTRLRYVLVRAGISSNMFQFPLSDPASPSFLTEIEKGLRVRLAPQGLTGTAYLEADYLDPSQNPPLEIDWQPKYPYVPSARSKITQLSDAVERILRNIGEIDLERLIGTMQNSLNTIGRIVQQANVEKISAQASQLLSEVRETNRQLQNLVNGPELKDAVKDTALAANKAREILERADKPLNQFINDLPKASESINRVVQRLDAASANLPETSVELRQTLQRLSRLISSQQQDIEKTVQNLRSASETLKELLDNSKRYPAQVFFGVPPPPSKVMNK